MTFIKNDSGYVLFMVVSLVAALSFFTITLLTVFRVRNKTVIDEANRVRAEYMAEAGIEKALSIIAVNGCNSDSLEEKIDERLHFKTRWFATGGYISVESEGYCLRRRVIKKALLGEKLPLQLSTAVTINEPGNDLIVAGNTKITGDIALISGNVFPSRSGIFNYSGAETQEGKVINLKEADTLFDGRVKAVIYNYSKMFSSVSGCDSVFKKSVFVERGSKERFKDKRIYIEGDLTVSDTIYGPAEIIAERNVLINNSAFIRNITIVSGNRIEIGGSAKLEKVVAYSRRNTILKNNAVFSGQLLSEDSIIINDSVSVNYPAFVYSLPSMHDGKFTGGIYIRTSSVNSGTFVVAIQDSIDQKAIPLSQSFFTISEKSAVKGIVYSMLPLEIKGNIIGHVSSKGFMFRTPGMQYKNWLLNVSIDRKSLDNNMLLPVLFSSYPKLKVLFYE
ncbi:MAG: hypothetical protein JNL74_16245 [Fibrobacteres bacterium]|nr:hypothetical protein [Fibrobacterota bacterium]